jgi:hypothetical protein
MTTKFATLFHFSNDIIQLNFKDGSCEILFGTDHFAIDPILKKGIVTYIDKNRNLQTFLLKDIKGFKKGSQMQNSLI